MRFHQLIWILLIITSFISCQKKYRISNGSVYFETYNEGSGEVIELVSEADVKTFREIEIENVNEFCFGRDKKHLFIDGELIQHIDPNSFRHLGNFLFRDKDSVYFFGFYNDIQKCSVKGINPNNIKLLEYPWAKAGNILIYGNDTLTIHDINSFKVIDEQWGKTDQYMINDNKILYGSDSKTFKIISSDAGKDKNFHFTYGIVAPYSFHKRKFKEFNFQNPNLCKSKPTVFYDLHPKLEAFILDDIKKYPVINKLKEVGFKIVEKQLYNDGESKILTVILSKKKCICYYEKLYQFDYSLGDHIKNKFEVIERIYFKPN